jgi:hypothetical protein
VAAYTQRIKNSLFGGLQVDIFAVGFPRGPLPV